MNTISEHMAVFKENICKFFCICRSSLDLIYCTVLFKKNGPTLSGYKCKFLREVHKSKLRSKAMQC